MADPAVAAAAAAAVKAVSLKLPTFLAARPNVWFQQTEAQFALRHIAEQTTQYYYLLTALDPVVAERMAGDIASVPEENTVEPQSYEPQSYELTGQPNGSIAILIWY